MMILFAPLLLVNMAMASENATTQGLLLMKTIVNDARWNGSIIQASDSFECSIKCQLLFPACQGFAWKDNTCFNIHILDARNKTKSSSTLFIQQKDVLRLRLQDRVDKSGHAPDFDPKVYVHQKWGFVLSKSRMGSKDAREICSLLGGQLPAVHEESVYNFFMDEIFANLEGQQAWLGLDIKKGVNNGYNCLNGECNGQLIWNDGVVFDHQPYYPCTLKDSNTNNMRSFQIKNKHAKPSCPEPRLPFITYSFAKANVICQIEIPAL